MVFNRGVLGWPSIEGIQEGLQSKGITVIHEDASVVCVFIVVSIGPVPSKDMQTPPPQKWPSLHKRCAMCWNE